MNLEEGDRLKYSILIYGSEAAAERLSPEAHAALLDGHRALQAALEKRGGFASVQLMPSTSAVSLKAPSPSAKPFVTDGPFADTKEQFLGFYVADFDSLEDAIEMSRMIASPNVTLEIRPISWVGGTYGSQ
jgi:hypothetical protein